MIPCRSKGKGVDSGRCKQENDAAMVVVCGGGGGPFGDGGEHGEEDGGLGDGDADDEEEEGHGADGALEALARGGEEDHVEEEVRRGFVKPVVGERAVQLACLACAYGTVDGRRVNAELGDGFLFQRHWCRSGVRVLDCALRAGLMNTCLLKIGSEGKAMPTT
jgi:hypothetical protein